MKNISRLIEAKIYLTKGFKFEIVNLVSSNPMKLIDVIKLLKYNFNSTSEITFTDDKNKNSFVIDIKKLINIHDFLPETTELILNRISKIN